MAKLKYYSVFLDGIDKAGKSTLVAYLAKLSNYTLNIFDRGVITNIVWNKIQNRDVDYDVEQWKNTVFIRLNVDKEDWKIRCSIHHEPDMPHSYEEMNERYDAVFDEFKKNGFKVLEFNTTLSTQYQIATSIIDYLKILNDE